MIWARKARPEDVLNFQPSGKQPYYVEEMMVDYIKMADFVLAFERGGDVWAFAGVNDAGGFWFHPGRLFYENPVAAARWSKKLAPFVIKLLGAKWTYLDSNIKRAADFLQFLGFNNSSGNFYEVKKSWQ